VTALGLLGFGCVIMLCVFLLSFLPGAQTTPVPTDTLEPSPDSGISLPILIASEDNRPNLVNAEPQRRRDEERVGFFALGVVNNL